MDENIQDAGGKLLAVGLGRDEVDKGDGGGGGGGEGDRRWTQRELRQRGQGKVEGERSRLVLRKAAAPWGEMLQDVARLWGEKRGADEVQLLGIVN